MKWLIACDSTNILLLNDLINNYVKQSLSVSCLAGDDGKTQPICKYLIGNQKYVLKFGT